MKDLVFYNLFKSNLLYYSWSQLKSVDFLGPYLSFRSLPSFSSFWFKKTAYLIRGGKFPYKMKTRVSCLKYKSKKMLVNKVNQLIIELSFIYIISHIKDSSLVSDLTKCLRYCKGKLLILFLY